MLATLTALIAASFLIALSPGPGTALVLRQSIKGRRSALATVAGMELAVACWAAAAALGLSALLTASEIAFHTLRLIGAAFLIYLGVKTLRARNAPPTHAEPTTKAFRSGLIVNLANPKLGVFALSFLPQFLPTGEPNKSVLLLFALVWVLVDTLWYLVVVTALHHVRTWLTKPRARRTLETTSGGALVGLGLKLVLTPR